MPKTITGAMETHLAGAVTSLATLWKVTPRNKPALHFTDHDVDVVFSGDTYKASSGYNRSALQNDSSLAVDNLDIESFVDAQDISEADLKAGVYDFADIEVFLVNWKDLSMGSVILRTGKLGEVGLSRQGFYKAELRGLTQHYSQRIGELYSAECRVDLGDPARCKIPILPDLVLRDTAYVVGDFVRVKTSGVTEPIPLTTGTNLGLNSLTGWTTQEGTPTLKTANPTPHEGSGYVNADASDTYEIDQIIDITTDLTTAKIDTGDYTMDFSSWYARHQFDFSDTGRIIVDFLDVSDVFITTGFDSGVLDPVSSNTWFEAALSAIAVPANTRKIRITLRGDEVGAASSTDFHWDDITVQFHDVAGLALEGFEIYENRSYECTTAGTTAATEPTYDTIVGNTTTDGGAIFTARESFTRSAEIDTVTDQETFTLKALTESRAVDDWFNGGLLTFHGASLNSGLSMEIRDWTQTGSDIKIFLPMNFVVSADDKVSLYPGCDKLLSTCRDKYANAINFHGEPYVPGTDELTSQPGSNL